MNWLCVRLLTPVKKMRVLSDSTIVMLLPAFT
jgi:hypothetical protein